MKSRTLMLAGIAAGLTSSAHAAVLLSENFDGGGVNSVFAYTNSSGGAPSTQNVGGGNANVARITNLNGSNNNSIAWNTVTVSPTPILRLSFDFFMTDDAANGGAGGCCGEAADGIGIGFFPNAVYGSTGAVNPAVGPSVFAWEAASAPSSLALGLDVFDGGGPNGNNARISWNNANIGDAVVGFPLNNNSWHKAVMTLTDSGSNSLVDLTIDGTPIFTGLNAMGVDLDGIGSNFRLIAGGRTGGAFAQGEIDNIVVEAIPEPSISVLMALVGVFGFASRRRKV
ncbi:MAG: PEP-CTERM sorting domain-containing protein [Verrucomicrobiales bacterium]|nr:PEP-CTERM sorting domain-containing protein [Verrucomicrobiales bacterium]